MSQVDKPDGFLDAVIQHCGLTVAMKIAMSYSGVELYVPQHPRAGQGLCDVIGIPAATVIAKKVGFGKFKVSQLGQSARQIQVGATKMAVKTAAADGVSNSRLARKLGCSLRTVEYHRKRMKERGEL